MFKSAVVTTAELPAKVSTTPKTKEPAQPVNQTVAKPAGKVPAKLAVPASSTTKPAAASLPTKSPATPMPAKPEKKRWWRSIDARVLDRLGPLVAASLVGVVLAGVAYFNRAERRPLPRASGWLFDETVSVGDREFLSGVPPTPPISTSPMPDDPEPRKHYGLPEFKGAESPEVDPRMLEVLREHLAEYLEEERVQSGRTKPSGIIGEIRDQLLSVSSLVIRMRGR